MLMCCLFEMTCALCTDHYVLDSANDSVPRVHVNALIEYIVFIVIIEYRRSATMKSTIY